MEVTQFTYFQQFGGIDLEVIPAEMTYGLERLGDLPLRQAAVFDLESAPGVTWGDVYQEDDASGPLPRRGGPVDVLQRRFDEHEAEAGELLDKGLPLPAYDQVLKASHAFNLLDARGAGRSPSALLTSAASTISRGASHSSTWGPMPTLLFEIGCEELPASACREAEFAASRG